MSDLHKRNDPFEGLERRFSRQMVRMTIPAVTQVRADGEDEKQYPNIEGVAAVFYNSSDPGTEYQLGPDFYERIMPGAFKEALARPDDVVCLWNHNTDHVLGRTTSGTLKLRTDAKGLVYLNDPPETQLGKQVTVSIQRGDVTGSSFAFYVQQADEHYIEEKRGDHMVLIREIHGTELVDVSPVTIPAYKSASVFLSGRSQQAISEFRSAHSKQTWRLRERELQLMRARMFN